MPRPASKLGRYKGPVIVLILSASLIAALAIPKVTTFEPKKEKAFVVSSIATGSVKRTEAAVGQFVKVGDPLLVITDPALEAEIVQLENDLKIAMLGTKEAVADTGMLGMIGTLPKVVWETPKELPQQEISGPPTSSTPSVPPANAAQVAETEKLADQAISKVFNSEVELAAREGELQEASVRVTLAETELANAERANGVATKERERLQKLFDMGAIAKNKLDSGIATSDQTAKEVEDAKAKLEQVKQTEQELNKQVERLKSDLVKLRAQLEEIRGKLKTLQSKTSPSRPAALTTTQTAPPKRIKRIVYGTSREESVAPVEVKLVDSKDPNKDQKVEAIRAKLLELKKKRDALRVTADVSGIVTFLATPNLNVRSGDHIATIQP